MQDFCRLVISAAYVSTARILTVTLLLCPAAAYALETGANANSDICRINRQLLDQSHTTWVRAFLPASAFIQGSRKVEADAGLALLRSAADSGRKLILSLKWDFARINGTTPAPGSAQEQRAFAWVDDILYKMSGRLVILSITNEMFPDTPPADLQPNRTGQIAYVSFLQRLSKHIANRHANGSEGGPLQVYVGGLTRLHVAKMQNEPAVRSMLTWIAHDKDITGVDIHMHVADIIQIEQALRFVRSRLPIKPIIVTEYSPIHRYKAHLAEALGVNEEGKRFAARFRLSPKMRVVDYINSALRAPVSQEQWHAFLQSRAWFNPKFLTEANAIMDRYGVTVATYGFSQEPKGHAQRVRAGHLTPEDLPWLLNTLYVGGVAASPSPNDTPVNYGLFPDYLKLQEPIAAACAARRSCPWDKGKSSQNTRSANISSPACAF